VEIFAIRQGSFRADQEYSDNCKPGLTVAQLGQAGGHADEELGIDMIQDVW
jgi:hypothetical protein